MTLSQEEIRILVAEDSRVHQKLLRAMIESCGYEVDVVSTGREAVMNAKSTEYGLIFMDCNMPDFGGLPASAAIAKMLGDRKPKIVGITADSANFDRATCLHAGMDDFLPKPHTAKRVRQALEQWLGDGDQSEDAVEREAAAAPADDSGTDDSSGDDAVDESGTGESESAAASEDRPPDS